MDGGAHQCFEIIDTRGERLDHRCFVTPEMGAQEIEVEGRLDLEDPFGRTLDGEACVEEHHGAEPLHRIFDTLARIDYTVLEAAADIFADGSQHFLLGGEVAIQGAPGNAARGTDVAHREAACTHLTDRAQRAVEYLFHARALIGCVRSIPGVFGNEFHPCASSSGRLCGTLT